MSSIHPGHLSGEGGGHEPLLRPSPHSLDHPGFEYRYGESYAASHGGFLPKDQFWMYEEYRHDLNPGQFDKHHAKFAPLLDRDEALRHEYDLHHPPTGLLPHTPYWDYLRYRHDLNPRRFDHYHPRLGKLLDRDEAYRLSHPVQAIDAFHTSHAVKPLITPAPEPGAMLLMAIGILSVGVRWLRHRRRDRRAKVATLAMA